MAMAIIAFLSQIITAYEMKDLLDDSSFGIGNIVGSALLTACLPIILSLAVYAIYKVHRNSMRQSEFIVSNKVVRGKIVGIFARKNYNYRLDEIENIEVVSLLGVNSLALQFSNGANNGNTPVVYRNGQQFMMGANVFRISCLVDIQEIYEKLSELLKNVKNDKEVAVEIEMKKLAVEERKAKAFETFSIGQKNDDVGSNNDDLSKLERLAQMKKSGLISNEEYEAKKEELLRRI